METPVGEGFKPFTDDEIARTTAAFPSTPFDANLLDEINKLRAYLGSPNDQLSSRKIVAVVLLAQQVDRLQRDGDEAATIKALHDSFPQFVRDQLRNENRSNSQASQATPQAQVPSDNNNRTVERSYHYRETQDGPGNSDTARTRTSNVRQRSAAAPTNEATRNTNEQQAPSVPPTNEAARDPVEQQVPSVPPTNEAARDPVEQQVPSVAPTNEAARDPNDQQTATVSETRKKSIAFQEFERALKKQESSTIYQLKDGTEYDVSLVDHFNKSPYDFSVRAVGYSYKLFATMAQIDTLWMMHSAWEVVASRDAENDPTVVVVDGLLNTAQEICRSFQIIATAEASSLKINVQYWIALYNLELQREDFVKELEQFPNVPAKLEKINEQIKILGAGKDLRATSSGRTVSSHIEWFYRAVAEKYGLGGQTNFRLRKRQSRLIKHLIGAFGNGVLGIMALEGYRSYAQYVKLEIIPELAEFTKSQTNIQKLFDFVSTNLIEPILANKAVSDEGARALCGLLSSDDWSELD